MSTYFENVHTIFKRPPQFPALCQNTYQNTSSLAALQKRSVLPRQVAAFGLGEDVQEEDGEVSVEDLGADGRDGCLASPSLSLFHRYADGPRKAADTCAAGIFTSRR